MCVLFGMVACGGFVLASEGKDILPLQVVLCGSGQA